MGALTMHVTHDEQQLRLRVTSLTWEAEGVLSLRLRSVDGGSLPAWSPGAHLDLHLPGGLVRQYSLCGDPDDRSSWRVAVLREVASRGGSTYVHDELRPGTVLDVVGPRNNFELDDAPAYTFVAGGIGITPLLAMVGAVSAAGRPWQLIYGGRTRAGMAFLDELTRHGDRVLVHPQDEVGLLDLDAALCTPVPGQQIYCCGPEPLLAAVEERCAALPPGTLHVERFAAKPRETPDPTAEHSVEAVFERSGTTVTVAPGQSILDAAELGGLDLPNSCREGICGTCETAVLEGLPDHRDSLLDEDERAANDTMMICVGRALSDRIVLDA
jgi:ferredoxin-NADP reductase